MAQVQWHNGKVIKTSASAPCSVPDIPHGLVGERVQTKPESSRFYWVLRKMNVASQDLLVYCFSQH